MPAKLSLTMDTKGLQSLGKNTRRQLGAVVQQTARAIELDAEKAIQTGPKTGRIYGAETAVSFTTGKGSEVSFTAHAGRKLGDDTVHQASAPGEAPATDTGKLAGSIGVNQVSELAAEIVVESEYAAALEFGTVDGHIAPRPFLAPAIERAKPAFEAGVASVLRKAGQ